MNFGDALNENAGENPREINGKNNEYTSWEYETSFENFFNGIWRDFWWNLEVASIVIARKTPDWVLGGKLNSWKNFVDTSWKITKQTPAEIVRLRCGRNPH